MRYYHMFPCAIPHRRADYPRVTHPSATSAHPRVDIRSTCMLKTRRQRSFWARIELSVMESCTEVQAAFHSILPFILTNSAYFSFFCLCSVLELTGASLLLFLFPLSLRLSCKKRPAPSKPLDCTPFPVLLSIPIRSSWSFRRHLPTTHIPYTIPN